ncbi:MAG: hypothetical protein LM577_00880 [Thermoproteaceae archaeon]|nr:hypothetical protein [Thermoproteaceae archaeon]
MSRAAAALLLLGAVALLASLAFLNVAQTAVNASLPPVSKRLNASLAPLAGAWWDAADGYNVTHYSMKFVPGWPELYTVGMFAPTRAGWEARLEKLAQVGTATYAIALGGVTQITESQGAGPYVAIGQNTPLDWYIYGSQRLSVLAYAWFRQGGITAIQLMNFTAEPMARLYSQTFSCPPSTHADGFSDYCTTYATGFPDASLLKFYTWSAAGGSEAYLDESFGNPKPSVYTEGKNGYGAAFVNLTRWIGGLPATGNLTVQYYLQAAITGGDYLQLNFFVDTDGDGRPDVEVVYYMSVRGREPACLSSAIYGYSITCISMLYSSQSPPIKTWLDWTVTKIYDYGTVVGLALVTYSPNGDTKSWWDNLRAVKCMLPPAVSTYVRGWQYTQVYISPSTSPTSPPSLATEVDAYGSTGSVYADWGAAVARYSLPQPVPAYSTTVSVQGRYVRDSADVQNNVAYVSIGVDTDGDGIVDREYIVYRHDVAAGQTGVIVSAFFADSSGSPLVVCTVDSSGACTPGDSRFAVINAGAMATGNNYLWSYTLYERGAVIAVALAAADASGRADGTADDFWIYWDDLTVQYSACPPPGGWGASGKYVWQSYGYLLVSGSAAAYRTLVANALTYVANFSGLGTYAVFDSSLSPIFGVSVNGSSFTALCGPSSVPLGSLPSAVWVELRPLNGLGDVIIRDQYGSVLARHGCRYAAAPQYVGFRGGLLRVYNITALG